MSRPVLSSVLLLSLAVSAWFIATAQSSAAGPLETTANFRWIVFASRQNVDEAIGLARRFGSEFGPPTVFSTTNGWYAVVAGPINVPDPVAMKKRLTDAWWPPKDTFLARGQTLIEKVWEAPKSPVLAAASSSKKAPRASAKGLEARIEASNGPRVVRAFSGGRVVASVAFEDDGPNNSTGASIVRLDGSSAFPQVVAKHSQVVRTAARSSRF
jgi:hypothetical protein